MLKKQRDLPLHKVDVEVFKLVVYGNEVEDQMAAIEKEQKKFCENMFRFGIAPPEVQTAFLQWYSSKMLQWAEKWEQATSGLTKSYKMISTRHLR